MEVSNGTASRKWKVFVVDNHCVVREHLSALIERMSDLEVCDCMEVRPETLSRIIECHPDLVVLDISSGRAKGMQLLKSLRTAAPNVRVLALSMEGDRCYGKRALQAGAIQHLTKQDSTSNLLSTIREIMERAAVHEKTAQSL